MAALQRALRSIDPVLMSTLGVALVFHLALLVVVMSVELPPPPSQADYVDWVKKIATPRREATVMPPIESAKELALPKGEGAGPTKEGEKGGPAKEGAGGPVARKGKPGPATGGGKGTGTGGGDRAVIRSKIGGAGVLGVIGVASGGGGGEFSDVFSSKGAVSEDVGKAMAGKMGVALPTAGTQLGRRGAGGEGGQGGTGTGTGGGGVADIGGVGTGGGGVGAGTGGGKVNTGTRKEASLSEAKVGSGATESLSGSIDRKSVASILSKKASGFRRCYERALNGNPDLAGKLVFEITIDGNGKVIDVNFVEDTVRSREVVDCVKGILLRIAFTKTEGGLAAFKSSLFFEPQK